MQGSAGVRGIDAYQRTQVQSRSPLELVVMLYDGAIRFLLQAREAIEVGDVGARTTAASRALDIVIELRNTLDMERGGDVARELDRLYAYITTRLLDVTRGDGAAAEDVHTLLSTLREGWIGIAAPGAPR